MLRRRSVKTNIGVLLLGLLAASALSAQQPPNRTAAIRDNSLRLTTRISISRDPVLAGESFRVRGRAENNTFSALEVFTPFQYSASSDVKQRRPLFELWKRNTNPDRPAGYDWDNLTRNPDENYLNSP